ncbi:hypothetical protein RSAG8_09828, partial [Rhizoctonia solani AG-8 WAC10335]
MVGIFHDLSTSLILLQGCDFPDVELVIQYTAPDSVVTHCQRMGRGARRANIRCRAIMMVTASDCERAVKLCGGGRVREGKPDDFLDPKREEDELLGDIEIQDGNNATEDEAEITTHTKNPKSRRFGLDIARFILAENCYVKILDEIFNNPEHISCYEAGTCSLCVARRIRDESAGSIDVQALDRAIKREQVNQALAEEEDTSQLDESSSNRRKTPSSSFTGEELRRRKAYLRTWRIKKFKEESLTCYIALEDIATEQALDAIARSCQAVDLGSLDNLKPQWPLRARWGEEILVALEDLHKEIDLEKKEKQAKRIEDRVREKEAKKEAARW